jgi:hypothetical protein
MEVSELDGISKIIVKNLNTIRPLQEKINN